MMKTTLTMAFALGVALGFAAEAEMVRDGGFESGGAKAPVVGLDRSDAIARGLEIRRARLGLGTLKLIDCRTFWRIGSQLVQEDPHIIVGDS